MFGQDKFLKLLKADLKTLGYSLVKKQDDDIYIIGDGEITLSCDLSDARYAFDKNGSTTRLKEFLANLKNNFSVKKKLVSFHKAKEHLRLMPLPVELAKEDAVIADFSEHIKSSVGYIDDDGRLVPLTNSLLKEWNIPDNVVFTMADRIISNELLNTKISVSKIAGDVKIIEFTPPTKGLTASLILCSGFFNRVSDFLGSRFFVIAPSYTSVVAIEYVGNDILEKIGEIIVNEYTWSDLPLSTEVILFDNNEISSVGRFSSTFRAE